MAKEYKEFKAGDSTVKARVSDGDESVMTTGGPRDPNKGDYVVATNNPNIVDVLSEEEWNSTDYGKGTATKKETR